MCSRIFPRRDGTVCSVLGGVMGEIIRINPVTRISGYLEIQVEVENNTIINANSSGLLYRGFETMLRGRVPLDAIYFTQRICGICSSAHSLASTLGLEYIANAFPSINDKYIRDIIHGFEIIQNHLRQFYLLSIPDFAIISSLRLVSDQAFQDYRLPNDINDRMERHYIECIDYSRLAHEGLAIIGGKAPHNHGIFVGGTTVRIDAYQLEKLKSIIHKILSFVNTAMLEDVYTLAEYYPDYYQKGVSYSNFMSYGTFLYDNSDITYVRPGIMINGMKGDLDVKHITEQVEFSWYQSNQVDGVDVVDLTKPEAYSFIKAPRYYGNPMEVGPLARMILTGEYTRGNSCMDRIIARVLETKKILELMLNLISLIQVLPNSQRTCLFPNKADGVGLVDTASGALGHWINIKDRRINYYNIITPSGWNLSPRDSNGTLGVVERALVGSAINDINNPVEIGRIVRSYDPCVSCATH